MLSNSIENKGYSAAVSAILLVAGRKIPLASAGPDHVVLREAAELAIDARAEVRLNVDDSTFVWDVLLPRGAVPFERYVDIEHI